MSLPCSVCGVPVDERLFMCEECQEKYGCRTPGCDRDTSDGEGYDGYCGTCADKIDQVITW
jgi:hypothetical protein